MEGTVDPHQANYRSLLLLPFFRPPPVPSPFPLYRIPILRICLIFLASPVLCGRLGFLSTVDFLPRRVLSAEIVILIPAVFHLSHRVRSKAFVPLVTVRVHVRARVGLRFVYHAGQLSVEHLSHFFFLPEPTSLDGALFFGALADKRSVRTIAILILTSGVSSLRDQLTARFHRGIDRPR